MKVSLLLLVLPAVASAYDCCLCDHCDDVALETASMITLDPLREGAATTCGDLALDVLEIQDEEMCKMIQTKYQNGCCSGGTCTKLFVLKIQRETTNKYCRSNLFDRHAQRSHIHLLQ